MDEHQRGFRSRKKGFYVSFSREYVGVVWCSVCASAWTADTPGMPVRCLSSITVDGVVDGWWCIGFAERGKMRRVWPEKSYVCC